ncbi:MAG: aminopeptidase [Eubacteriales bacterium]|nr:aminopeptidase [Eubacteriales bacterium]
MRNCWLKYNENDLALVHELGERYKTFLSECKTERECTDFFVEKAKKHGYVNLEDLMDTDTILKPGDKIYANCMGKTVAFFQIGKRPLTEGMNLLCAHIDSPRMDLKQVPLYEDSELAYLDTHYYGGIKKYQWVTLPLALHGVVVKKDGSVIPVTIGEDEKDPIVYITDLLIHLSARQMEKKASNVIEGEQLDILVGSRPLEGEEKDAVKANVMALLKEKYDMEEEDFLSAEIEVVPAGKARDCGLDRSMIAGYGHDDRVCAYPSFEAMLEVEIPERTSGCILVDKEEIGSVGATGMESKFFENTVAELLALTGTDSNLAVRRTLARSKMLSSDVSAAFDPAFAEAFEKRNSAFFGRGIVINKYTGSRGKGGSNDANAEYLAQIRRIFDENEVSFQTAELGKVDFGGGGTIAFIAALHGMDVVDSGVAVLSMHGPWELISKADLYEAKKGYVAFLKNA